MPDDGHLAFAFTTPWKRSRRPCSGDVCNSSRLCNTQSIWSGGCTSWEGRPLRHLRVCCLQPVAGVEHAHRAAPICSKDKTLTTKPKSSSDPVQHLCQRSTSKTAPASNTRRSVPTCQIQGVWEVFVLPQNLLQVGQHHADQEVSTDICPAIRKLSRADHHGEGGGGPSTCLGQ